MKGIVISKIYCKAMMYWLAPFWILSGITEEMWRTNVSSQKMYDEEMTGETDSAQKETRIDTREKKRNRTNSFFFQTTLWTRTTKSSQERTALKDEIPTNERHNFFPSYCFINGNHDDRNFESVGTRIQSIFVTLRTCIHRYVWRMR